MEIIIESKRRKKLGEKYPDAWILDVTSKSEYGGLQKLSPFYPHGNIPVPFTEGMTATCVEAIWQGLKVFDKCGIDVSTFNNNTMKNLKRSVKKYGVPLGHQKGVDSNELLDYIHARMEIYLPTYKWVLDNVDSVRGVIEKIKEKSKEKDIVFLDYNTNIDPWNTDKPLSHAGLLKLYIEDKYPDIPKEVDYKEYYKKKEIKKENKRGKKKSSNKKSCRKVKQTSLF